MAFLCLFVLIVACLFGRRARAQGSLELGRVLFPTWRFFDETGYVPQLFYRVQRGEWVQVTVAQPRTWKELFVNPPGNLNLSYHTLLARFIADLRQDTVPIEQTVSYHLLQNLIRTHARMKEEPFQFWVRVIYQDSLKLQDVFVSFPK